MDKKGGNRREYWEAGYVQLWLTWLFGWRWDGEAEVSAVFTVQPPFVLLPAPPHPVQTYTCRTKKTPLCSRFRDISIFMQPFSSDILENWVTTYHTIRHMRDYLQSPPRGRGSHLICPLCRIYALLLKAVWAPRARANRFYMVKWNGVVRDFSVTRINSFDSPGNKRIRLGWSFNFLTPTIH